MSFGDLHYTLSVKDLRTGEEITSGVSAYVYDAGTKTLSTLYSNSVRGAFTNPVTFTAFSNRLDFWGSATTYDIFLADDKGNTSFIPSVAPTDHTLTLNRDGVDKCFIFPFSANTSETDTGLDFPKNVWIYDVALEVVTVDASETMDVGILSSETSGDANGLAAAMSVATAGWVRLYAITDTTTEDHVATPYKGALMGLGTAGTSTANDTGNHGGLGHVVTSSSGQSLTYTHSAGTDTAAGYGYVFFKHLR